MHTAILVIIFYYYLFLNEYGQRLLRWHAKNDTKDNCRFCARNFYDLTSTQNLLSQVTVQHRTYGFIFVDVGLLSQLTGVEGP